MDLVYIVKDVAVDLARSLRALHRYATNIGRVVVASPDRPALSQVPVEWLPTDTTPYGRSYRAGFLNTCAVIPRVLSRLNSQVVLLMNDDFIAVRPVDLDDWPLYIGKPKTNGKSYWRQMNRRTLAMLRKSGLPTVRTNFHLPGYVNCEDAAAASVLAEPYVRSRTPICIRSVLTAMYMKTHPEKLTTRLDYDPLFKWEKHRSMDEAAVAHAVAGMPPFISYNQVLSRFTGLHSFLDRTTGPDDAP